MTVLGCVSIRLGRVHSSRLIVDFHGRLSHLASSHLSILDDVHGRDWLELGQVLWSSRFVVRPLVVEVLRLSQLGLRSHWTHFEHGVVSKPMFWAVQIRECAVSFGRHKRELLAFRQVSLKQILKLQFSVLILLVDLSDSFVGLSHLTRFVASVA